MIRRSAGISHIELHPNFQITRHYETVGVPGRYRGFTATSEAPLSLSLSLSYDSSGRLGTVESSAVTARYRYDAANRLSEVRRYLDTAAAAADADFSLPATHPALVLASTTYQPHGYGVKSRTNRVGEAIRSRFDYTMNALGQRTAVVHTGTAFERPSHFAYGYNEKGEVTHGNRFEGTDPTNPGLPIEPDTFAYQFDDIGNRTSSTRSPGSDLQASTAYAVNLLNQYTEIETDTPDLPAPISHLLAHDPDGNLTDDGRWIYTWKRSEGVNV